MTSFNCTKIVNGNLFHLRVLYTVRSIKKKVFKSLTQFSKKCDLAGFRTGFLNIYCMYYLKINMRIFLTLSSIVAALKSGKNASSSILKNNSCVSIPYTRSRNNTMLCLWPGINPDGISLLGFVSPAAGLSKVNRRESTPWRSSNGTKDLSIALARRDSFLPLLLKNNNNYIGLNWGYEI